MSFWVEHGLHLALVVIPSSAMGTGLALERRKGVRQRRSATSEPAVVSGSTVPAAVSESAVPEPAVPVGRPSWAPVRSGSWDARPTAPVVALGRADPRDRPKAAVRHPAALPVVAISAAGAALVHLVVMPAHFRVSLLYGTFFLSASMLQMLWALAVTYRPSRQVLLSGAIGCAATILLWLVSRTVGIPAALGGIQGGAPEAVGPLDVLASIFEAIAVLGVIGGLPGVPLGGGSPARWPVAAKAFAVTALVGTATVVFFTPVN